MFPKITFQNIFKILILLTFGIILNSSDCNESKQTTEPENSDCKIWAEKSLPNDCLLINDMWGRDYGVKHVTDYEQCISNNSQNNVINCGWNWRWTNPIGSNWVKAYPEILFGKNPHNTRLSTTPLLPIKISNLNKIEVKYKSTINLTGQTNNYNLCFDLWITDSPNPTEANIKTEIMVWELGTFTPWPEILPAHYPVVVDGFPYELYDFYHASLKYQYRAFLPKFTPNIADRIIKLEPFINYLKAKDDINDNQFLSNVTFGTELVEGSGTINISDYSLTLNKRLTQLSENFDDGDFTNNPQWNLTPSGSGCWAPGTREVINGEFHIKDMDSPGCGHGTQLDMNLDITVNDITKIKFDVKPVYSDVRNGAGDTHEEYPAMIWLDLYDSNNKLLRLWFCYNYRGGSSKNQNDYIRVAFPNVQQNEWQRNQTFRIKDYFVNAVRISKITIGANGWDYEAYFDNISIVSQ